MFTTPLNVLFSLKSHPSPNPVLCHSQCLKLYTLVQISFQSVGDQSSIPFNTGASSPTGISWISSLSPERGFRLHVLQQQGYKNIPTSTSRRELSGTSGCRGWYQIAAPAFSSAICRLVYSLAPSALDVQVSSRTKFPALRTDSLWKRHPGCVVSIHTDEICLL